MDEQAMQHCGKSNDTILDVPSFEHAARKTQEEISPAKRLAVSRSGK